MAASIRKNIAFNLKRLMRAKGLNQRELGESIGASESKVSNWMKERNFMEEKVFDLLREKHGWTYDQLVADPGAVVPSEVVEFAKVVVRSAGYKIGTKDS